VGSDMCIRHRHTAATAVAAAAAAVWPLIRP
jgi:hypothetical protein